MNIMHTIDLIFSTVVVVTAILCFIQFLWMWFSNSAGARLMRGIATTIPFAAHVALSLVGAAVSFAASFLFTYIQLPLVGQVCLWMAMLTPLALLLLDALYRSDDKSAIV